ncbi:MAG TPA: Fic family protein [Actinomycetota bacterium]|nr:Fic family protein [Actinomycetota bacterium]
MTILPYTVTDSIKELIEELDAWKRLLDVRVLPRAWEGRLRRDLEAEAVAASTRMEGVNVTVDEVRRILAGDRPADVEPEDRRLVEGYRDAMNFVLRQADDLAFSWDRGLIVGLHDRVMAGRYDLGAGRLRTNHQVWVRNRLTGEDVYLPPGEDVDALFEEAVAQLRTLEPHPAVTAAWVHVATAAIHPFRDGNGRSARILASLAMYRGDFNLKEFTSLEEWWGRHLAEYYDLFRCLGSSWDPGADVTPFIEGHIRAQVQQVHALDLRVQTEQQVWLAVEEAAEDVGLERRLANALWDAFFGREITAGYYRSLTDVSPATATKDLIVAVAAGLLASEGERRGRRYLAGAKLYPAVAETLFISDLESAESPRDRIVSELEGRLTTSGEALGFPRRPSAEG